jgi:molybdopterin converting factor small subunit
MPAIKFTSHLRRFFPDLTDGVRVEGRTIAEVVGALDRQFPGLADYLIDDQGALRQHVNIFVDDSLILDREALSDAVSETDRIFIFQALSGG